MRLPQLKKERLMRLALCTSLALGLGAVSAAQVQKDTAPEKKVERTWSAKLGQLAPDFELEDTAGTSWKLSDQRGKTVVLEWFNPGCPVVKKAHAPGGALERLGNIAGGEGVVWVAINSGAGSGDGSDAKTNEGGRKALGIDYPVLLDTSSWVGRMYGATNTPHMFIIGKDGKLVYSGGHVDGDGVNLVAKALVEYTKGGSVGTARTRASGCAVKYAARARVGLAAPDFELSGCEGAKQRLSDLRGEYVVLEWFSPTCPVVKRAHEEGGSLQGLASRVAHKGVKWLAINSGATGKPEDNQRAAERWSLSHPILTDADGKTGKTFGAVTTPQMFVIDQRGVIVYHGAPAPQRGGGPNYIEQALTESMSGKPVSIPETKSYGCGVKYAN